MASLLSGNRKSLLDQPIGIDESRKRQADERQASNEVHRTRRIERAGRRGYREAMRKGNGIAALEALEKMESMGGSSSTLKIAGRDRIASDQLDAGRRAQIDAFGNKTVDENGRVIRPQRSRILGDGSGSGPESAKASSSGGEWVNVGPGGGRPPQANASPDTLSSRVNPGFQTALGRLQAKWQNEARANDPARQQAAYEAQNGTLAQQNAANTPPAATTRHDSLVDKYASQFPGIEKLKGLSDADKAGSVAHGKAAGEAYGRKIDETLDRARGVVSDVRSEVQSRQAVVTDLQARVAEAMRPGLPKAPSREDHLTPVGSDGRHQGPHPPVINDESVPSATTAPPAETSSASTLLGTRQARQGGLNVRFGRESHTGDLLSGITPAFIPDAPRPTKSDLGKKKRDQWRKDSESGKNTPEFLRGTIAGRLLQLLQRPNL